MKSFWKNSAAVSQRIAAAGKLLVTLDFDGTLAALAEMPHLARLTPEFKAALRTLAAAPGVSVFILSGRALENVKKLAGLRNLYYGGNHGIQIQGPDYAWRDVTAARTRNMIAAIAADISERFPAGTGVLVENKTFSASVHFRNLKAAYKKGFLSHMQALACARNRQLRWQRGHKVFELLPAGAAHKGNAVTRLADHLRSQLVVAVGDDLTDEAMFTTLGRSGVTVRVGGDRPSSATYYISRQSEVLKLLRLLSSIRRPK